MASHASHASLISIIWFKLYPPQCGGSIYILKVYHQYKSADGSIHLI